MFSGAARFLPVYGLGGPPVWWEVVRTALPFTFLRMVPDPVSEDRQMSIFTQNLHDEPLATLGYVSDEGVFVGRLMRFCAWAGSVPGW